MRYSENAGDGAEGVHSRDEDDQLQPEDTLIDRGVDDVLDEGYSSPDFPPRMDALGHTWGQGASLDQLLSEEEPDPAARINGPLDADEKWRSDASEEAAEFPRHAEVGGARAGRLVAPDEGVGEDNEAELYASDVGIDGGAASAEEAAIHIVDEE